MANSMVVATDRPVPSGLAHHSAAVSGIISPTISASPALRPPSLSIEAPMNGAVAITAQPAHCCHWEMTSWPFTGSPIIEPAT